MRHINIPIFIPHLGCPNQCVFCNQRSISGVSEFHPEDVIPIIEDALLTVENDAMVEIAFFGGSFTNVPFRGMRYKSPLSTRAQITLLTVMRETPNSEQSFSSVAKQLPTTEVLARSSSIRRIF